MKTILNWKRGLFRNIYEIYSNRTHVGYLKEKSLTQSSHGELYGEKFHFRIKGIFNKEAVVFNSESNTQIGKISYNSWMTKSKIEYGTKVYYWKFDNFWNTSWRLYSEDGSEITYNCSSTKGKIEYDSENNFLVLAGLYVHNYYWQTTLVTMVIVFLPIWVALFN